MAYERRTEKAVKSAIESLTEVLNGSCDKTLSEIRQLESLNRASAVKYASMNSAAEGLEADADFLKETNREIKKYVEQVDLVSTEVSRLEALVAEMDEWSAELAVKVKRL